ncbi:MAG: hypothetical protein HYR94_02585 [Chloroflexi bacterium]|nr:hypothetical protein [Chloroflexota bacterium]
MPTPIVRKMGQITFLTILVLIMATWPGPAPQTALAQQGAAPAGTATSPPTLPVELEEPSASATPPPPATEEPAVEPTATPLPVEINEPGPPAPAPTPPLVPVEERPLSGPPLLFIENDGQIPVLASGETVRFQVSGQQASLSLTDTALWFTVLEPPHPTPRLRASMNLNL